MDCVHGPVHGPGPSGGPWTPVHVLYTSALDVCPLVSNRFITLFTFACLSQFMKSLWACGVCVTKSNQSISKARQRGTLHTEDAFNTRQWLAYGAVFI